MTPRLQTATLTAAILGLAGLNAVQAMQVKYVPLPGEQRQLTEQREAPKHRRVQIITEVEGAAEANKLYLLSMSGKVSIKDAKPLAATAQAPQSPNGNASTAPANATNLAEPVEAAPAAQPAPAEAVIQPPRPVVQIAILLDNSGSMRGLIDQARSELWKIVNQFAKAKHQGQQPQLQVALYAYGRPPAQRLVPLTTDLDTVSEKLFGLAVSGGSEYCGQVIDMAVNDLKWTDSNNDLKLIFIAGNEPFTQGPVDYRRACADAIAKGIIVNTIHCGDENAGLNGHWKEGAQLADGKFLNINHDAVVAHIESPHDATIAELGVELNKTYIPFGRNGAAGFRNQALQDNNAATVNEQVAVQRALTKASANYVNGFWCLADACRLGEVDITRVKDEDLPEHMRKMTMEQRKAYVDKKLEERAAIQKQIAELNGKREAFVSAKRREMADDGQRTLDEAVIEAVREQAAKKDYRL